MKNRTNYIQIHLLLLIICLSGYGCISEQKDIVEVEEPKSGYQLEPVDIQHVKVTDEFWLPIIKRVQ